MTGNTESNCRNQALSQATLKGLLSFLRVLCASVVNLSVLTSSTSKQLHVEKAQPRNMILVQQPLVNVLLVQLLDLGSVHLAAVGRQIAVGLGAHLQNSIIGSGRQQSSEDLLFRNREPAFKIFHRHRRCL